MLGRLAGLAPPRPVVGAIAGRWRRRQCGPKLCELRFPDEERDSKAELDGQSLRPDLQLFAHRVETKLVLIPKRERDNFPVLIRCDVTCDRTPHARQALVGHRSGQVLRREIGIAEQAGEHAMGLGGRHPIRAVERQSLGLTAPRAHGRRPPGSETTLGADGCWISNNARRAISSLWLAMNLE